MSRRVRDELFDARQSLDRQRRARWTLFVRLLRELEPELGPGEFDTAFDRSTGRADLVYDTGTTTMSVDRLGTGVQRLVALLGSLVLVRATLVGLPAVGCDYLPRTDGLRRVAQCRRRHPPRWWRSGGTGA